MGEAKRAALRAAVVSTLQARVKETDKNARADILDQLEPGDRLTARYKGHVIAAVRVDPGKVTPSVTDPDKFAAWCAENYPTEVDMKPVVKPAFIAAVLAASKEAGQACVPDGTECPGVAVREGDPFVVITSTGEAQEVVALMVSDGYVLPTGEFKQIEGEQ